MKDLVNTYIDSLIPERTPLLMEMEAYAREHKVPIMELAGIETMLQIMRIQNPVRILEIGTAIGYSALRMAEALPQATIVSIELDDERYEQASRNISRSPHESRIVLLKGDALELQLEAEKYGKYDALFIDAAKGQYMKFFNLYSRMLSGQGCVYSDNVLFKGLVAEETVENKRIRGMVSKIKTYNHWLMAHPEFTTAIIPVGDGLAVSSRKSAQIAERGNS